MTLILIFIYIDTFLTWEYIMISRGNHPFWNISPKKCIKITQEHRNLVIKIIHKFSNKLKKLLEEDNTNERIKPNKLQNLVVKVCSDTAIALERKNSERNKKNYEDLSHGLQKICENTFKDIINSIWNWETPKQYKEIVMMNFLNKLENLWENHDKDKETPDNLKIYTHLLNNLWDKKLQEKWKRIHNHNNTHHVEWFLRCKKPKLQYLVEMVCDNVATAIARDAKYGNIFEENKKRYINKWLSESLAEVCANTFVDLWNTMHLKKRNKKFSRLWALRINRLNLHFANQRLSKITKNSIK